MARAHRASTWLLLGVASLIGAQAAAAQSEKLPENKGFVTIAAIMRENCAICHAWATSYSGIASPLRIVATLPEKSLLYQKIKSDSMPPSGKKLSSQEKALIRAWLAAGASSTDTPVVESTGIPEPCPCGLPQKPAPETNR
ncbi:MAG: cytochrome c [Spirochaetia bacterium]|jgi:uncharacterized membrane protein